MSYPKNPNTIVIQNKFYSKGLTELDIWNYYQKVKPNLLKNLQNRDVMMFIMVDKNKAIVRRRLDNKVIRLKPNNYDQIITGRTVSLHSGMSAHESFGIIDIDISPNDGFRWAKEATNRVYNYVMDKMPVIRSASIRYTGKQSFHIKCDFGRKMKTEVIQFLIKKFLLNSELSKIYTIDQKRRSGVPNLDLSPNKFRGNHITVDSLSIWGLRCMEVDYVNLRSFDQREALIKYK